MNQTTTNTDNTNASTAGTPDEFYDNWTPKQISKELVQAKDCLMWATARGDLPEIARWQAAMTKLSFFKEMLEERERNEGKRHE